MATLSRVKNAEKRGILSALKSDLHINYTLYILMIPVIIYYIIFCYKPMYGAIIAFKDYQPAVGILSSPWAGVKHFKAFFLNPDFPRIFKNTLTISGCCILFGFPAPIILALLFNELKFNKFKSLTQTIAYMPHFISLVVVCGLVKTFVSNGGIIFEIVSKLTGKEVGLLNIPAYFVPIYVLSDIWQGVGWGSIIYVAALSGIDSELYEAAMIDGAGKWKQLWNVTLPGIAPTITIMFILRLGSLFSVGYEKVILLYNPLTYETADIISSYVYRMGLGNQNWSYSAAVGLFNSVINFVIVILANTISRRVSETSLW